MPIERHQKGPSMLADSSGGMTFRCRATVDDERCDFTGTREQLTEHAAEAEHPTCQICGITLNEYERQVCAVRGDKEKRATCVERLDATLADILDAYATLPDTVEHSGYHQAPLPGGNALVMLTDGSVTGGGPDDHIKFRDPPPVLAELYRHERDWAELLEEPREARGDATVTSTIAWMRRWLPVVVRRHDAVDVMAADLRDLHSTLIHTAGLADDPKDAPAECFDCGGRLQRRYRPLREPVEDRLRRATHWASRDDQRIKKHAAKQARKHPDEPPPRLRVHSRATRLRQAAAGDDREGLADTWTCAQCHRSYDEAAYGLALRMRANSTTGWVTVRVAAETLRRPARTIWRWVEDLDVTAACSVTTRRVLIDWEQTKERSDVVGRRNRGQAAS